jgi:hypothetical protein
VAAEATLRRRWPQAGGYPSLDKPEYFGKIEDDRVVEKLLSQGGVRVCTVYR